MPHDHCQLFKVVATIKITWANHLVLWFFNSLLWLLRRKSCLGYAWISCRKGNVFILNKTPSGEIQFGCGLVYLILISVRVHLDPQPVMKSILCSQFWVIHKLITQVPSGLWVFKQCSIKPWVLCGRAESGRTGWVGRSVGERGSRAFHSLLNGS